MRRARTLLAIVVLALTLSGPASAADGKVVVVEFQPASDDEAGLAYLVYTTVSEEINGSGRDDVVAGEDVEMFLGGAAVDCNRKSSCLLKLAEHFDATVAVFTTIARKGTQLSVEVNFVSLRSGAILESAKRRYEAGEEGAIAALVLDRVEGALEAASYEDEDLASTVADGGEEDVEWTDDNDDQSDAIAVAAPTGGDDRDEDDDRYRRDEDDRSDERDEGGADDKDDRYRRGQDDSARYRRDDDRYRRSDDDGDRDRSDEDDDDRYRRSSRDEQDQGDDRDKDRYRRSARDSDEDDRDRRRSADAADGAAAEDDDGAKKTKKDRSSTKKKKGDEDGDADTDDEGKSQDQLIDPDLFDTFDDDDSGRYDETSRTGSGQDMTEEEAAQHGIGKSEFRQFQWSGMSVGEWKHHRFDHKGRFHIRAGGFYGLGGLDMYYSTRVVVNPSTGEAMENYYWQSLGFSSSSGGGSLGVGFGISSVVEIGLEFGVIAGEQWLLRERRTPDATTINTFGTTSSPPPQGTAAYLAVEPKVRFYALPFKRVKPYGSIALAMVFMPGFIIPEEWADDRPGSFVLGLQPAVGVQLELHNNFGMFLELPFTGFLATDHAVETATEGEAAYLGDLEKNEMYPPTRFMMQVKLGVQIRI